MTMLSIQMNAAVYLDDPLTGGGVNRVLSYGFDLTY